MKDFAHRSAGRPAVLIALAALLAAAAAAREDDRAAELDRIRTAIERTGGRWEASDNPILDLAHALAHPLYIQNNRLTPEEGGGIALFEMTGGTVKWNGVVLAAPRGREVRSVYHGRVAFADWLAGMGLLVIVDHGDGYMTLYGYNETILKDTGDWVAPGDVIATVGDSGGQPQASLYFELRRGTRPENPRSWVTRQPGS